MKSKRKVKFIAAGEMHFGIVVGSPKVPEPSLLNELEVVDAIKPQTWILEAQHVYDVPVSQRDDQSEYDAYVARQLANAQEVSNSIRGCKPGKLIKFPVSNHWSYYQVIVDSSSRLLKLEWRGYDPSRVIHPDFGWEFTMPRKDCLRYIEIDDYLNCLLKWAPK